MSKPLVYNYKTAEERIARQKKLIFYMAETIAKISAERDKHKGVAERALAAWVELREDNNRLKEKIKLVQARNEQLEYLLKWSEPHKGE